MNSRFPPVSCMLLILAAGLSACSKEKFNELIDKTKQHVSTGADKVKQSVTAATDTAKEQLNLAGQAQFNLDSPIVIAGCYASFLHPGEDRPSVLQIRSYRDPAQESFPSMLLRAQVPAKSASELVGQVVTAQLFLQKDSNSPVWYCSPGTHVELKIISADAQTLAAEIIGGTVRHTHKDDNENVTGTLSAVWQ